MNKALISRYSPESEFLTPERCYINELANTLDDEDCSIAVARVPPGTTTELHSLRSVVERYVIIEGEGWAEIDGRETRVGRFDVVSIPAGRSQRITNTTTRDLLFLCVCTPRFTPEVYDRLEGPSDANR